MGPFHIISFSSYSAKSVNSPPKHTPSKREREISLTHIKSSLIQQGLCLFGIFLSRQIVVYPTLETNMLKIR